MQSLKQWTSAAELEQYLGDPSEDSNPLSFKLAVEQDERDEYPEAACRMLDEWGFYDYYVPAEHGGKLASFEELISLVRVIARRDPTVAYANLVTVWGSMCVWVAGSREQKQRLAGVIKRNGHVGLGFTEREHGNDLLASDVRAIKNADGYLLRGEKWPLSHGTRGRALTVFARTGDEGGPRGFSMFFLEKDRLDESSYTCLPKLKTHGVRGTDVSGLRFNDCQIPADALIGAPGAGLEMMLRFTQVTRAIIPAISLGAADTALRVTLDFALRRRLYGEAVFAIPHARRTIVDAFLDLIVCECVAVSAARGLHAATEQMRLWSSVAKYFIPTTAQNAVNNLSVVLGARHYLREGHWSGIFQKIIRDNSVTGSFHVGLFLNFITIAVHLKYLADHPAKAKAREARELEATLETVFSLDKPLPAFDPARLSLLNRGVDDMTQGVELSLHRIHDLCKRSDADMELLANLSSLTRELIEEIDREAKTWKELEGDFGRDFNDSPEMYELAKRHAALHAAAACVHLWVHNRDGLGDFFAKGEWLALCLDRLLAGLTPSRPPLPDSYFERAASELSRLYEENLLFSITPIPLARRAA